MGTKPALVCRGNLLCGIGVCFWTFLFPNSTQFPYTECPLPHCEQPPVDGHWVVPVFRGYNKHYYTCLLVFMYREGIWLGVELIGHIVTLSIFHFFVLDPFPAHFLQQMFTEHCHI